MTILYAEDDSMTVMEVQEKLENNGSMDLWDWYLVS